MPTHLSDVAPRCHTANRPSRSLPAINRSPRRHARAVTVGREAPDIDLATEPLLEAEGVNGRAELAGMAAQASEYRALALQRPYSDRFRHAWLLMDRDTQADDNAEHLYRYIREHHPEVNAWFLLRESSHDWARLRRAGFRLIAFGSLAHKMALLNAEHLISSHADPYVAQYLPAHYYGDSGQPVFTFLQHGVIQSDLSGWLNYRPIRRFITSAQVEYDSIVGDGSRYRFTKREVALTGMPRHDALLRKRKTRPAPRHMVVMPTWRHSLMGETLGMTNDRMRNPDFTKSVFYRTWRGLLASDELVGLARRHGYELVFFPHANLKPYLDDFRLPNVRVLGHGDVESIQDVFLDTAALITDYSSVAFELAYLKRPVVYYQFDEDELFQGGHFTEKGYFDYRKHGFGPVCTNEQGVLRAVASILATGCAPAMPYAQRMREFFAFRDGRCCERVFELIAATTRSDHCGVQLPATSRRIQSSSTVGSSAGLLSSAY